MIAHPQGEVVRFPDETREYIKLTKRDDWGYFTYGLKDGSRWRMRDRFNTFYVWPNGALGQCRTAVVPTDNPEYDMGRVEVVHTERYYVLTEVNSLSVLIPVEDVWVSRDAFVEVR